MSKNKNISQFRPSSSLHAQKILTQSAEMHLQGQQEKGINGEVEGGGKGGVNQFPSSLHLLPG